MSEEEMKLFYELINNFEFVGSLTEEGRLLVKRGAQHLKNEISILNDKIDNYEKRINKVLSYITTGMLKKYPQLTEDTIINVLKNEYTEIMKKELILEENNEQF